jgi:hypothetical protein
MCKFTAPITLEHRTLEIVEFSAPSADVCLNFDILLALLMNSAHDEDVN